MVIVGRQSGKIRIASLIASYESAFGGDVEAGGGELYALMVAQDHRASLRAIFSYARAPFENVPTLNTLVVQPKADSIELRNGSIEAIKVFEPEQEEALLGWFHTNCRRLHPMVLIGFGAGLRYGEAIALETADYDPMRHRLRVNQHWTPEGVIVGTKSSRIARGVIRTREVPTHLDPRLEPALEAHINWLQETKRRGWDGKRLFPARPSTKPH